MGASELTRNSSMNCPPGVERSFQTAGKETNKENSFPLLEFVKRARKRAWPGCPLPQSWPQAGMFVWSVVRKQMRIHTKRKISEEKGNRYFDHQRAPGYGIFIILRLENSDQEVI